MAPNYKLMDATMAAFNAKTAGNAAKAAGAAKASSAKVSTGSTKLGTGSAKVSTGSTKTGTSDAKKSTGMPQTRLEAERKRKEEEEEKKRREEERKQQQKQQSRVQKGVQSGSQTGQEKSRSRTLAQYLMDQAVPEQAGMTGQEKSRSRTTNWNSAASRNYLAETVTQPKTEEKKSASGRTYEQLTQQANKLQREKELVLLSGGTAANTAGYDARIADLLMQAQQLRPEEKKGPSRHSTSSYSTQTKTNADRDQLLAEYNKAVEAERAAAGYAADGPGLAEAAKRATDTRKELEERLKDLNRKLGNPIYEGLADESRPRDMFEGWAGDRAAGSMAAVGTGLEWAGTNLGINPLTDAGATLFGGAKDIRAQAEKDWGSATEDMSNTGKTIANIGKTVADMTMDMVDNFIVPGSGRLAMGLRTGGFGALTQDERENNDINSRMGKAAMDGALAYLSEYLVGGAEAVYGKSVLGKAISQAVGNLSKPVQYGIKTLLNTEGLEEGLEYALGYLGDRYLGFDQEAAQNFDPRHPFRALADMNESDKGELWQNVAVGYIVGVLFNGVAGGISYDAKHIRNVVDEAIEAADSGMTPEQIVQTAMLQPNEDVKIEAGKQREDTQVFAPEAQPEAQQTPEQQQVVDILLSESGKDGGVSNSQANKVLADPALMQAFQEVTGVDLNQITDKSEQRKTVKSMGVLEKARQRMQTGQQAQTSQEAQNAPQSNPAPQGTNTLAETVENDVRGLTGQNESEKPVSIPAGVKAGQMKRGDGSVSYDGADVDGVHYDAVDVSKLSNTQRRQISAVGTLAKASGVNVVFFESKLDDQGRYVGANGFYKDGTLYLDVNAGLESRMADGSTVGEVAIVRTGGHEMTHFIQDFNETDYNTMRDFIVNQLVQKTGAEGLDELIQQKMDRDASGQLTREEALDEVIADGCEMMLKDTKAVEQLAKENLPLATRIRDWIREWVGRIKAAFEGVDSTHKEAKILMEQADQLQKMWDDALVKASKNNKQTGSTEGDTRYSYSDIREDTDAQEDERREASITAGREVAAGDSVVNIDTKTETANPTSVKFSRRTWEESDYVTERNKAAKELAEAIGVSQAKAQQYIDDVNSVARAIADERVRLDYEDTGLSPFVSNAEYGGSFDFTTLCKKRRLLTGTFSAIQNALPNTALTANEILDIRKRMDEAGLEVSCGKCYVEGSRASMGQFTKEFLNLYKKYNPDAEYVPNMAEMNTPDGIEKVRNEHPEVYEQYEYFWNHYGTLRPGDPNLFASQQKPKLYQMRSAYKGEVLKNFHDKASIEEKNRNGGVRLQSFSDFEIVHLIDAMQVITDMARVGLNGQAYTKVPDFAWALGKTGLKINLSIDAWSVDENGQLVFNNKEGMNFDEAMRIRDANSENVGTICCVYDDAQLMAAMADDRIDFIIPFHRSQWKKSQYKGMGLPATTKDYTYQQNEKWLNPDAHTHEYRGKQVKDKCRNYMPNEYWDFSKSGRENAEEYLRMCAEDGKRPKFYKLLTNNGDGSFSLKEDGSTDGYWKLLIDFKMYDNNGKGSPQRPVRPTFNMEEVNRMLGSYEGGHSQFPVAHGIVDEFVQDYKAKHPGQTQFQLRENGTGRIPPRQQPQTGTQTGPAPQQAPQNSYDTQNPFNVGAPAAENGRERISQFFSNTLLKREDAGENEPITYRTKKDIDTLTNAVRRLGSNFEGEMAGLLTAGAWTDEQVHMARAIGKQLLADGRKSGDMTAYRMWRDTEAAKIRETARGLRAVALEGDPGAEAVLRETEHIFHDLREQKNSNVSEQEIRQAEKETDSIVQQMLELEERQNEQEKSGYANPMRALSVKEGYLELADRINAIRNTGFIRDAGKNARIRDGERNVQTAFRRMLEKQDLEYIKRYVACQAAGIADDLNYKGRQDTMKRLNTFQKLAQLTGTGTWGRNLEGNAVFSLVDLLASNNPVTLAADAILGQSTGKRSQGLEGGYLSGKSWRQASQNLERSILEVAGNIDLADGDQTKYDTSRTRTYDPNGSVMSRLLSRWEQWNGYMLQSSDAWFKGITEGSVREAVIRANGWDANNLTAAQKKDLNEVTKMVAEYRTFQNRGMTAQAANGLRDGLNKLFNKNWKPGQFGVGTAILPYTTVPANIGVKALEFSPAGAVKGLAEMIRVAKDGKNAGLARQNQAVTDLGRGVTGTALIVGLAALMKQIPWFKDWEEEEDKDVKAQNRAEGKSGMQFNLDLLMRSVLDGDDDPTWRNSDRAIDISSIEPLNQIITAASLMADDKEFSQAVLQSAKDSFMDIPAVQQLKNIEDTIKYTDTPDDLKQTLLNTAASTAGGIVGGFIPAPVRHATAAADEYQRDTSGDNAAERAWNQIVASTPWRKNLPIKTDSFGTPMEQGSLGTRLATQYLPSKYTQIRQGDVSREMERLREATDEVLVPARNGPGSVSFGSGKNKETVKLTAAEKKDYKDTLGQAYEEAVENLMQTNVYKKADDAGKAEMISVLESYARDEAKDELARKEGMAYEGQYDAVRKLDKPEQYLAAHELWGSAMKEGDWDTVDMLLQSSMSDKDREYMREHTDKFGTYYDFAQDGVSARKADQYQTEVKDLYTSEDRSAANGYDILRTVANGDYTDEEADAIMNRTKSDGSYYAGKGRVAVYNAVRAEGYGRDVALQFWDLLDTNQNGQLTKKELKAAIGAFPEPYRSNIRRAVSSAMGW